MDNAPPKQPDPDDRPANPATADFKNQPWYMELRNEFRSEFLDGQEKRFNGWLTIFAIVITLAGFIGFDQFNKLEKDIIERFDKLEADINVRFDKLGDDLGARVTEVEVLVEQIRGFRDKVEKDAKAIAELREVTAEKVANAPKTVRTIADNIKNNPKASPLDKAIARAVSLQQQGKRDEAIEEWESIAKLSERIDDDLAARAWISIGYLHQDKNWEAAILAYDKAIGLKQDKAVAYSNRGAAKSELGRYEDAIADFDKAIDLDPYYAAAYSNRGVTKSESGDPLNALADLDKAIRLQPFNARSYNNRGYAKNMLGKYEDAIADFEEAINLSPGEANPYNHRGYAKKELGKYEAAIADINKAISLKPNYAAAYYNRGLAKSALGSKAEARTDFKTARELARDANDAKIVAQAEESLRDLDPDGGS